MWNGVVDVENVQVKTGHYFRHLGGKHEIVRRIFKKRIREDLDFMKVNVVGHCQSNGKRVAYKVHVMTMGSEFLTQLRSDDTAATIRRIAGDPDLHSSMT